jgi:AraC-like DNA-binding protein
VEQTVPSRLRRKAVIEDPKVASDSRYECRDALLHLRGYRPPKDLLLAAAGPASRQHGVVPDSFYQHKADSVELAVVTRGQARIATPTELFRVTPGKLLVIERGVYHAELFPPDGHEYHTYWCHLDHTRAHVSFHQFSPEEARLLPEWDLPGRTNVEQIGGAIAQELSARDWDHPRAVGALLDYLTCLLARRALRGAMVSRPAREAPSISLDSGKSALLQAVLDFCDAHFREGVTQADVARAVGSSPRHLGRLVSGYLGHSLSHHLRNLRMTEARYLLQNTDLPVRTIGAAVGYPYPAHFTRAFVRDVGISPDSFRRRLGNG